MSAERVFQRLVILKTATSDLRGIVSVKMASQEKLLGTETMHTEVVHLRNVILKTQTESSEKVADAKMDLLARSRGTAILLAAIARPLLAPSRIRMANQGQHASVKRVTLGQSHGMEGTHLATVCLDARHSRVHGRWRGKKMCLACRASRTRVALRTVLRVACLLVAPRLVLCIIRLQHRRRYALLRIVLMGSTIRSVAE